MLLAFGWWLVIFHSYSWLTEPVVQVFQLYGLLDMTLGCLYVGFVIPFYEIIGFWVIFNQKPVCLSKTVIASESETVIVSSSVFE